MHTPSCRNLCSVASVSALLVSNTDSVISKLEPRRRKLRGLERAYDRLDQALTAELRRGDIDCDLEAVRPWRPPVRKHDEDPFSQGNDQPYFSSAMGMNWCGRDQPPRGMAPAQQRFEAADPIQAQIVERLVEQLELFLSIASRRSSSSARRFCRIASIAGSQNRHVPGRPSWPVQGHIGVLRSFSPLVPSPGAGEMPTLQPIAARCPLNS